ncbi:STAS domain-containing protein [Luteimonas yindakuii]|uniref:STAS domain-containing protein n=1 Tax=Luteimonas yindakuii TaxID=2565782 RepID=A0A4Z1REZ3_9GAMM|nr:STAS domain-containing protein [Luteimonas yindakuii]QCO66667.1 STAS domain-containing protein [Luteimonas yindakuii]TKS53247.1 STAS domain-containing protein [Luteimonas yindakuii]
MPQSTDAHVRREGDALAFAGPLLRADVARLWPAALRVVDGARRFDLAAVTRIDSAGLALLSELAARTGGDVVVDGAPDGLSELRAAYRMQMDLDFSRT